MLYSVIISLEVYQTVRIDHLKESSNILTLWILEVMCVRWCPWWCVFVWRCRYCGWIPERRVFYGCKIVYIYNPWQRTETSICLAIPAAEAITNRFRDRDTPNQRQLQWSNEQNEVIKCQLNVSQQLARSSM